MGPRWRWRSMVVAGAVALGSVASAHAAGLPAPEVSAASVPSAPKVTAPSLPSASPPPAPSVSAPRLPSVSAPSLPSTPAPSVSAPAGRALAPVAPAWLGSVAAAPARSGGTVASQPAGASAPAASRRSPSARSRSRGRRAEPSSKRLHELLQPLSGCVSVLGPLQERVLVRRAGLQGFEGHTRRQVARSLGLSLARVTRLEHRGLRHLRHAVRTGGCSAAPVSSSAIDSPSTFASTQGGGPAGATGASAASASAAAPDRQEIKGVSQSGGGESPVERMLRAGPRIVANTPRTIAAVTAEARSYADDHPLAFGLAVLVTLLAAALLVRELRRAV